MPHPTIAFACRPAPLPDRPVVSVPPRAVRVGSDAPEGPLRDSVIAALRALFPVEGFGDAALWSHVARNFAEFGVLLGEHGLPLGLVGLHDIVLEGRPALLIGALGIVPERRTEVARSYSDLVRAAIGLRLRAASPPEVLVGCTFHPGRWDVAASTPPRSVPYEAAPDWSRAASCVFALPATPDHVLGASWRIMRTALSVPGPEELVEPGRAFETETLESLSLELETLGQTATGPIETLDPRLVRREVAEG